MTADVIPNVAVKVCIKMIPFKLSVLQCAVISATFLLSGLYFNNVNHCFASGCFGV